MKKCWILFLIVGVGASALWAQEKGTKNNVNKEVLAAPYTKKVLDKIAVQTLFSYYEQSGNNAAVTGGEGTEELTNAAPTMVVQIPVGQDGVLTIDSGLSAYTSASSSNVNPFDGEQNASPWVASSGASRSDVLAHFNPSYTHYSADRNTVYVASLAVAKEYDYQSFGFGLGISKLFYEKNTELGVNFKVYLDEHSPQYPIELRSGFFDSNIVGEGVYNPNFVAFSQPKRNTYALSFSFSQILTSKMQASFFADVVMQEGLLSSPLQRVYFADRPDFFIDDFQLADDVERLPFNRYKFPVGLRYNYYILDWLTLRSYARYYMDSWGVGGLTTEIELPIALHSSWTVFPSWRYYEQSAADYFFAKEVASSSQTYYTSDYDLSAFTSQQWGVGIRYTDIFTRFNLWKLGLKSIELRYINYQRSNSLSFDQTALGFNFEID